MKSVVSCFQWVAVWQLAVTSHRLKPPWTNWQGAFLLCTSDKNQGEHNVYCDAFLSSVSHSYGIISLEALFFFKCTWRTFSKLAEADPAKALTNTHHHHLEIVIRWLTGVITEKSVAFMDRLRNVWTAKKSTLSRRDCKLCPVNYKVLKALPNALSCPHRSEKARPEWHHLLLWLQPLPICLRLWLLLPLRWPLLLPGRHPAGSAADPSPRRSHPSALLPRRQLPVHRRPQGNARTDSHTASSREIPEGNNRCWTHTNYQLCLGVKQVTDVALHNINTQVWCKALHDTQSSQHVSAT